MSFKISALAAAVVAVTTLVAAPIASAVTVTVVGTNFDISYDDSTLFGTARLVGNNIIFTPTDFLADSLDGAGLVHTRDTLDLVLTAHAGFDVSALKLLERGDYRLTGAGSTAAVEGTFGVFGFADPFTEVKNSFTAGALTNASGSLTSWSAGTTLTGLHSVDQTAGLNITLSNDLLGGTVVGSVGTEGFVEKKFAAEGVMIGVNPVPEPETYALMLAGLGVIGMVARRRQQK